MVDFLAAPRASNTPVAILDYRPAEMGANQPQTVARGSCHTQSTLLLTTPASAHMRRGDARVPLGIAIAGCLQLENLCVDG